MTVGRRESCDIPLRFPDISGLHCQLYFRNGYWYVKDLNSTNGVKVNGTRVQDKVLHPRDELSIGRKRKYVIEYEMPTGQSMMEEDEEDIMGQSLLEKAGLEKPPRPRRAAGPAPAATPPTSSWPTTTIRWQDRASGRREPADTICTSAGSRRPLAHQQRHREFAQHLRQPKRAVGRGQRFASEDVPPAANAFRSRQAHRRVLPHPARWIRLPPPAAGASGTAARPPPPSGRPSGGRSRRRVTVRGPSASSGAYAPSANSPGFSRRHCKARCVT